MTIDQLYQETILKYNRSPKNFYEMDGPTNKAVGNNGLCGDFLTVFMQINNEEIAEISFFGECCAISMASASMMTDYLKGKTVAESFKAFADFHRLLGVEEDGRTKSHNEKKCEGIVDMGEINVLANLRNFSSRIKSATLCWHAMKAAIAGDSSASVEQ